MDMFPMPGGADPTFKLGSLILEPLKLYATLSVCVCVRTRGCARVYKQIENPALTKQRADKHLQATPKSNSHIENSPPFEMDSICIIQDIPLTFTTKVAASAYHTPENEQLCQE